MTVDQFKDKMNIINYDFKAKPLEVKKLIIQFYIKIHKYIKNNIIIKLNFII